MRHKGEVTGVRQHHGGKHVVVDVAHGPLAKPKRGGSPFSVDDRPSSSIVIPKAQASRFPVGKQVHVSMSTPPDTDGDRGEDLDQMQQRLRQSRKR